jgi:formylglycine-generating enzyme required for sulfatase activity
MLLKIWLKIAQSFTIISLSLAAIAEGGVTANAVIQPKGWGVQNQDLTCMVHTEALGAENEHAWHIKMGYLTPYKDVFMFSISNPVLSDLKMPEETKAWLVVDKKDFEAIGISLIDGEFILPTKNGITLQESLLVANAVGIKVQTPADQKPIWLQNFKLANIPGATQWLNACTTQWLNALSEAGGKESAQSENQEVNKEKKSPPSRDTFTNSIGMEFVKVSAGSFVRGWGPREDDPFASKANTPPKDQKPQHTVNLSQDFWIGKYEVTQKQWHAVLGYNPSFYTTDVVGENSGDYPVESIDYYELQIFIKRLNVIEGKNYRLPTEAEWEYACRSGGKDEKYCGGNNANKVAWTFKHGDKMGPHRVGTKKANGLGIHDMSGNVAELCSDFYQHNYYYNAPANDPQGPPYSDRPNSDEPNTIPIKVGDHTTEQRVVRGGSYLAGAGYYDIVDPRLLIALLPIEAAEAAYRHYHSDLDGLGVFQKHRALGFRLVAPQSGE